ncbi:MAG TPA: UDP-2,3-diacylglucosamine diphosphatase [Ramlibacter sp.]|uniref:UDP-2,3-diacylglucosamine diphosphatase n=1 Tax=Ramlibacter sp. TaxID=1917967 RepID=UPI002D7F004E|nr:UDP-2,3-diacylglucosamine diphosphatase [Ramlibacter sp.]HET8746167.1 UDP-2,3-diacylglucosamine diphosphatase [Ramlibacter sp.]
MECISDLHLQPAHPATFEAWRRYMADSPADALFLLGDLFEAWVGDDVIAAGGFEAECAEVLRATAQRVPVFFMVGNRDFLVGERLAQATGMTLLSDPAVLCFGERRWLLSHGDALCIGDTEYQAFRAQVRGAEWQQGFLAQPLSVRQAVARGLREESEALKQTDRIYSDVDTATAVQWLQAADAEVLVHGHTHKPAEHALDARHRRIVLTDWDAEAVPPRLEALRIAREGTVQRIGLA